MPSKPGHDAKVNDRVSSSCMALNSPGGVLIEHLLHTKHTTMINLLF
jgi:hypothetical protein